MQHARDQLRNAYECTGIQAFVGQLKTVCYILSVFLFLGLVTLLIVPTEAIIPEGKTIIVSLQDGVVFQDGITTSIESPDP